VEPQTPTEVGGGSEGGSRETQETEVVCTEKIQSEKGSQTEDDPGEKEKLDETPHILLSTEMSGSQTMTHPGMRTSSRHLKHPWLSNTCTCWEGLLAVFSREAVLALASWS